MCSGERLVNRVTERRASGSEWTDSIERMKKRGLWSYQFGLLSKNRVSGTLLEMTFT